MFLRVDKLQIELPAPTKQDPNAAAALQELLGGKYGEMSTLGNYLFQSFNFRSKSKLRPFYSLVAAITAEEIGHVELVSNGVAMLANGPDKPEGDAKDGGDVSGAPYEAMKDVRLAGAFFSHAGGATLVNSNAMSWNADMVTTTGNVIVDLLHNFHLECGARLHKLRVYETLSDPTGREVCGYLLVRGSVHAHAYALALKKLTGVELEKFLPTPNIPWVRSRSAISIWSRAHTGASTRSVPRTIRNSPASGAVTRLRCRTIRRVNSKWSKEPRTGARSTT